MVRSLPQIAEHIRAGLDYWILAGLVIASFLFGGGARDDILSLVILRPLGALALIYALAGVRLEQVRQFRGPVLFVVALIGLILLHLIPLPPAVWSAFPGREILVEGDKLVGIEEPWRPLSMVPWRTWNAFYAMLLPTAAMLLAIRCRRDQRRALVPVVLACGFASVMFGMLQAIGGYRPSLYFYAITNFEYPVGLFANRNHQAAMIAGLLPLVAVYAHRMASAGGRVWLWLATAMGAIMLLVLLITGSRAGIVLSLVSLACVALTYPSGLKEGRARKMFFLALLALGALLVALLVATFLQIGGLERLMNFDPQEESRLRSWPVIVDLIPKYFPFGAGIGSFAEVYMVDEPRELLGASYLNHAHSDPLEWALDGGLPAILLTLWAIAAWLNRTVAAVRKLPKHQSADRLPLAASAAILILGLASLVDYPLRVPSLAVVAALAAVWMTESQKGREQRMDRKEAGTSIPA